jgi:heavy metal sensor kinase
MIGWFRSFKVKLTLWYVASMSLVLLLFAVSTYEIVEHRLENELDRQLRIDFDIVEAQLDTTGEGEMQWSVIGAHGDEGFARLFAWFEIWSEDGSLLLRHWPISDASIHHPLPAPHPSGLQFYSVELQDNFPVRIMERPARVGGRGVVVRILRDESDMHGTLHQIVDVYAFAMPLALALAALGGYALARRSLSPVTAMTAQARQITSESLQSRLPVTHPHDELGQLAQVFNETLARLERSFNELKRFSADASHELRTPLTALRAVGELALQQPASAEDLREAIESMLEEAQRLSGLTDALLMLARLESGTLSVFRDVDMHAMLDEVRDTLLVLADAKGQIIDTHESAQSPHVRGEPILLRHALLNILHNAIRHSPEGSRIQISTSVEDARLVIDISDEGSGIDPEFQEKIFERFFRVDESRSRTAGGYGLGLAIAKSAIEQHGGEIEVAKSSAHGTTLRIRLPVL